jgi:methyltransferase (TIGR00027 family)
MGYSFLAALRLGFTAGTPSESITMKPVSKTAYYCCAVRALDAAASRSVLGDRYAERFMTPEAWEIFEPFRRLREPNASNVARHRLIDDILRERLAGRRDTGIVIIGAGFDTRPFRLTGGRWVELDEPAVMTLKEAALPAREAPNPLTRLAVEFDREPLAAVLAPFRDLDRPIVVLEGVLPYLTEREAAALLGAVRTTFAAPTLICDLMTRRFARRYGGPIGRRLRALGAPYHPPVREPLELIEAAGFRLLSRQSVVGHASTLGLVAAPPWLLNTLLRTLRDGYAIATFDATAAVTAT